MILEKAIGGMTLRLTTKFKNRLQQPSLIMAPGVVDAMNARLVAEAGFEAIYMTGAGTTAARLGMPDVGLLSVIEMADNAGRIADASGLPLISDADTGYGSPVNVFRTVSLFEKAGVVYAGSGNAPDIAQTVSTQIEKEIMMELKLAQAFREIAINSQTQVLPIQTDALPATWGSNAATSGNLTNRPQENANQYNANQVILKATRLVSTTFMDNNIDEEVLVNLMPMLIEGVARAHARAVDDAILNGTSGGAAGFNGLEALAGSVKVDVLDANASGGTDLAVTAAEFLAARKLMGKYGMNASDLVYVVSQARYYDLLADAAFADITDVGSDIATKITGTVGAIYGTPVIVSDQIEAEANGASVGYAVNVRNHVIPRLRGVSIEQDYEVMNQRNVIVASQSLGFNQLRPNNGTTDVSVVALKRTDA